MSQYVTTTMQEFTGCGNASATSIREGQRDVTLLGQLRQTQGQPLY